MHDNGASYCRPTRLLNSTLPALTRDRAMTPSRHVPDPPKLWRDFGHFCASAPFVFVKTNLIVGPPFEPKALTLGRLAPAVGAMNAQVKSGPTDMAARYGVGTTVLEMARAFRRLSVERVRRRPQRPAQLFRRSRLAFAVARLCHGASAAFFPRPVITAIADCFSAAAFSSIIR